MSDPVHPRAFKSSWFARAAKRAKISDAILCKAIAEVIAGKADDLGGGVYKKRLSNNQYRSIILARGGDYWVYQFLYAKRNQANIDASELAGFRAIAKDYAAMTQAQADAQVTDGHWIEICKNELEQNDEQDAV